MSNQESKYQGYSSDDYQIFKNQSENPAEPVNSGGLLWKMGSGMYNKTKGTVGLGVGAVKFVANTSQAYTAISKTTEVGVNATKVVAQVGYNAVSRTGFYVAGGVSSVTSKLPSVPLPSYKKTIDKEE